MLHIHWVDATYYKSTGKLRDEDGQPFLAGDPSFKSQLEAEHYLYEHDIRATIERIV